MEPAQRVERIAVNRAPGHEALAVGRERTQQRLAAVGHHQRLVGLEDVRDLRLVGLDLVEGLPHVGVQVGRVLQLDQHQRQAVDEQHDVGPARVIWPSDRKLIDGQPLVARRVGPVHQTHKVATRFAVLLVLHRHAADEQPVEVTVGGQQHRRTQVQYLPDGVLTRRCGHGRVQRDHRGAQAPEQQHLAVVVALGRVAIGRERCCQPTSASHARHSCSSRSSVMGSLPAVRRKQRS
jgi:hypothetical protein